MKKSALLLILILLTSLCVGSIAYASENHQISKTYATMEVDSTLKLYISKTSTKNVRWSSSDENIASISAWGTIIALSEGEATITATFKNQTYTCNITVVNSTTRPETTPIIITPTPEQPPSEEEKINSQFKENILPQTKSFLTIGIDKDYLDVNDASYTNKTIPAFAMISYSDIPESYITGISCPTPGTIRFHFNQVIRNNNTIMIEYSVHKSNKNNKEKEVDLAIFMGQSNASGVGNASLAPTVQSYMGSEFRAISDPTTLYDLCEPFGVNENKELGINDRKLKKGSMVSAFVNSYYNQTERKLVCISASQGATSIEDWQPDTNRLKDAINRFQSAITYLEANGYTIKNKFVVWLQGETDGGLGTSPEVYTARLKKTIDAMIEGGADNFYIVRIGNNRDNQDLYTPIISAQTDLCKSYPKAILVSTKLSIMNQNNMMKDAFHYTQQGYNIVGYDAGMNVAYHILTGKEPNMYDYQYKNIYNSYYKLNQ